MGLLLRYSINNLLMRKLTTALTVVGVGLVVFVFAAVLMMANGLEQTMIDTGSADNAIVVRRAANAETVSIIPRDQGAVVTTQPEIAVTPDGTALAFSEIVVLLSIEKRTKEGKANVIARGTDKDILKLRSNIVLSSGRMFTPGTSEVIAGAAVAKNFSGCGLGEHVSFAGREWTVVGTFDAGGAAFDSELWGDADQIQQAFRRQIYSSVTMRLADPGQFDQLKERLESDPRLTVEVRRETEFYAAQTAITTTFIRVMGLVISIVFSLGAMIGAMITMYAAVANRTVEIGTLRALGFSRRTVMGVFLAESIWLSLLGGIVGMIGASFMSAVSVSTTNWDTFSELAFDFALSPTIIVGGIVFALVMGFVGGFLPAVRGARLQIVNALREE